MIDKMKKRERVAFFITLTDDTMARRRMRFRHSSRSPRLRVSPLSYSAAFTPCAVLQPSSFLVGWSGESCRLTPVNVLSRAWGDIRHGDAMNTIDSQQRVLFFEWRRLVNPHRHSSWHPVVSKLRVKRLQRVL